MEGFVGFSFGPRTCLGRKFATVEAVAFLVCLLRDWRVEAIMQGDETPTQWRERVLEPKMGVTLFFGDIPIRLVKRHT